MLVVCETGQRGAVALAHGTRNPRRDLGRVEGANGGVLDGYKEGACTHDSGEGPLLMSDIRDPADTAALGVKALPTCG